MDAITLDEARALPGDKRAVGMKVKGAERPFDGSWKHFEDEDLWELTELPTLMPGYPGYAAAVKAAGEKAIVFHPAEETPAAENKE